ncbi:MAG: pilin [Patescibacteria group bacterium]
MIKRQFYLFGFGLILLATVLQIRKVEAASVAACFCVDQDGNPTCKSKDDAAGVVDCITDPTCAAPNSKWENDPATCDAAVLDWNNKKAGGTFFGPTGKYAPPDQPKSTLSSLISKCGQKDMDKDCYDVTVFISLALDMVKYLFGIIGGVALLFFVYGGFVFILSQGNPERITHGKAILINAVIGIVIAFSGYALVRFLGTVVGIKSGYTLL